MSYDKPIRRIAIVGTGAQQAKVLAVEAHV